MAFFLGSSTWYSTQENSQGQKTLTYALKVWEIKLAAPSSVSLGTRPLVCKQHQIHQGMKGLQIHLHHADLWGKAGKFTHPPTLREERAPPGWGGSQCFTHGCCPGKKWTRLAAFIPHPSINTRSEELLPRASQKTPFMMFIYWKLWLSPRGKKKKAFHQRPSLCLVFNF